MKSGLFNIYFEERFRNTFYRSSDIQMITWEKHIIRKIHNADIEFLKYMLTPESMKDSSWSPDVLAAAREEINWQENVAFEEALKGAK